MHHADPSSLPPSDESARHRTLIVRPARGPLRGVVRVPGDKSISHRVLLFGALAEGTSEATGWLAAEDCLATLRILHALGVPIERPARDHVVVHGVGLHGLQEPAQVLDCGGSGTTMRLLAGILAGQPFTTVLSGNEALRRRPMGRITKPLTAMGATILARGGPEAARAPLAIRGGNLRPADYRLPVASAQIKSAILLAALYAPGRSRIEEPGPARDHTERMLARMGVPVQVSGRQVTIAPPSGPLRPLRAPDGGPNRVPADPSSAAFPLVAATLVHGSEVRLEGVGSNPTRTGLVDLLRTMGADIRQESATPDAAEPAADLVVTGSELLGGTFGGNQIVRAIDEFPILAVAATQADGSTTVRDAAELRVKESDRIASVCRELGRMGVPLEEAADGFTVHGPVRLRGAVVDSHMDHRLAMALAVAALLADGESRIERAEVIDDSFPGFVPLMQALGAEMEWDDVME